MAKTIIIDKDLPALPLREVSAAVETHGLAILASTTEPPTTWLPVNALDGLLIQSNPRDAVACWALIDEYAEIRAYVEMYDAEIQGVPAVLILELLEDDLTAVLWRNPRAAVGSIDYFQQRCEEKIPGSEWRRITKASDLPGLEDTPRTPELDDADTSHAREDTPPG